MSRPQPVPAQLESEESLDPQDWEALRGLGHRMLDEMFDYLRDVRERPVWRSMPEASRQALRRPAPMAGEGPESAYRDFQEHVLPYPYGNIHPRFWGWVNGTGSPLGMLSEMLASAMNPNVGGFDQAATHVEFQVLNWLKELFGYPPEASGLLLSGGSMANLIPLAVARNTRPPFEVRKKGLLGRDQLVVYASDEVHSSVPKAVELLGIGSDSLRLVPVDSAWRIDLSALRRAIAQDRAEGRFPLAVVGTAGTINTGAIDDLEGLADLCQEENLWLHIDGAYGAFLALSPKHRHLVRGMERADSLACDLHKWMYMPFECGCALVRRAADHRKAFALTPDYLRPLPGGPSAMGLVFGDHGVQLSRGFKALKVWMTLKAYGAEKFGRLVEQNVRQAAYLGELVEADPALELLTPVSINVACLRYKGGVQGEEALSSLNQGLLVRLQEEGIALPSGTLLKGKFCFKVTITNHRTRLEDMEALTRETARIGRELELARR